MRKPYSSPNFDDPVEYLARPLFGHAAPSENAGNPAKSAPALTITVIVNLGRTGPISEENRLEDHYG
jgi:hypothetical protein